MAKFTGLMRCTSTKFKIYAMFYRVTRQQTWREYLVLELARVAKFEVSFLSGAATCDCETSDFYITHHPLTAPVNMGPSLTISSAVAFDP